MSTRPNSHGFLLYLFVPEPGPVGVRVESHGEAFGPSVLSDGPIVLFGLAPAPPVVLPSMELPVVVELPAVPPAVELPPAIPAALPPTRGAAARASTRALCEGGAESQN
jgi:hypothetical protein